MSRILVLTPRYPYPVIGGDRLRIFHICRELARYHELTLLSLAETQAEMLHTPDDGLFSRVERVYHPRWRAYLNSLMAIPGNTPLQIAYYRNLTFRRKVAALLPEHELCLAHLIRTGQYLQDAQIPCVLEMTDAISLNYTRVKALRKKRGWKSHVYAMEAKRLLSYERAAIRDFDLVTLVSENDRIFLENGTIHDNLQVCSNGTSLEFHNLFDEASEPLALFIGNMLTVQNIDACDYFITEILPLLQRRRQWRLRIVGRIGDAHFRRWSALPDVEVTGPVDNIAEAARGAYVGICPMRIGAGVQNKILEYMALGLPAVTSPLAHEGLGAVPGREVAVADVAVSFAHEIERLYLNREAAAAMAGAGQDYVRRAHDWKTLLRPMVEGINELLIRPNDFITSRAGRTVGMAPLR